MASKALMVLGFLSVALVLISSEAAAREMAENAEEIQTKDPVNYAKQGYGGGYPGGGNGGGYPGGGYPGRGYPGRGYPYPGRGHGCRYGCCGRSYYGCRCCTYQGEVPDFKTDAKPHN